jgi:hypothetical protein
MSELMNEGNEVFTKRIKAGKRTYFFDVKETKSGEYYITLTESKKRFNSDTGKFFYEKHKIFLYKEDYTKFRAGLNEVIDFIQENQGFDESYERFQNDEESND